MLQARRKRRSDLDNAQPGSFFKSFEGSSLPLLFAFFFIIPPLEFDSVRPRTGANSLSQPDQRGITGPVDTLYTLRRIRGGKVLKKVVEQLFQKYARCFVDARTLALSRSRYVQVLNS